MENIVIVLSMLFCHIVDDYYLQGWLASAKQKSWWEKNNPNPLYKNDYKMALLEHAFSWTFMIHVPVMLASVTVNLEVNRYLFIILFMINWGIHALVDNAKANKLKINLVQDQLIHVVQIVVSWGIYIILESPFSKIIN